ncbi:MAG: DKNYY domain-containing protein [Cyclobacteriaceae bacterium]|nr:DKNYY domain-containing protein [Cyclobacteriaceae bacterium]
MFTILGILAFAALLFLISFFIRLGKPVNAALSDSYYHHGWKRKIIYSPMGNWFELGYHETEADPSTFQVLSKEFGKDNRFIFWKGRQQQVDHATFEIDANGTPKDASQVYYHFTYQNSLLIIEGADPKTYRPHIFNPETYYQRWGLDDYAVFLEGKKLDVDRQTFNQLNSTLAIDSSHVYIITHNSAASTSAQVLKTMPNPGGTATAINNYHARIGNTILVSNWKNNFASHTFKAIDSIRVLDERNIVVNDILLSDGKIIADVDLSTFEVVNREYLKDKRNVYYDTELILSADPQSFTPVLEDYAKDNQYVYYKTKILEGADPKTFAFNYATGIGSDSKLFFKDGELVNDNKK